MAYTKTYWKDRIKDSQGNIVQEGTPVSAGNLNKIEQGIEDAHKQMEKAAKETVSLPYGLSVLNSPNGSPLDVQIEGRTLVSLGNSDLEGGKYYVLADPKAAVIVDGTTYKGVSKFTGKNVRPSIIRTANFEGKTTASTIDNPHISKHNSNASANTSYPTLMSPSSFPFEVGTGYNSFQKLDGLTVSVNTPAINGTIAQTLFSFNLIEEVERKIGKIPASTVADKVTWLQNNLTRLAFSWYGLGSSSSGSKANVKRWKADAWRANTSAFEHTNNYISKLMATDTDFNGFIQADGFVHFLAHAEASDGTIPSSITTDYIDLDIELKPNANFYAPRIPLYEVSKESYDKILVEWDAAAVANRYPMVDGVKSLQNPNVVIEGENLFSSFYEATLAGSQLTVVSPTQLDIDITGANSYTSDSIFKVVPGQTYTFSVQTEGTATGGIVVRSKSGTTTIVNTQALPDSGKVTFTAPAGIDTIYIRLYNWTQNINTKVTFKDPMFVVGSEAKPFKPSNPSYLYAEATLRGFNNINDSLYQEDGRWRILKKWETMLLDGSLGWDPQNMDFPGFKRFRLSGISNYMYNSQVLLKYNGSLVPVGTVEATVNRNTLNSTGFYVTIADAETGFAESYTPTAEEVKAYFNGWKAKTLDASNKPTAWVSVIDGKDAPTQTLAYVAANKAPDYIGYRLFYQLATPKIDDITDKVEGSLSVSGQTHISLDSGLIIKEKVNPYLNQGDWIINANNLPSGKLSHPTSRILAVYKNQNIDKMWRLIESGFAYGNQRAVTKPEFYDSTAEYFVTYIILDKETLTVNPVNAKASYNTSIRSTVDQMSEQLADVRSLASIHDRYLYKLLLAAKANGWSV